MKNLIALRKEVLDRPEWKGIANAKVIIESKAALWEKYLAQARKQRRR